MEITPSTELFQQAGLTKDQAALYAVLLSKGAQTARAVTFEAKVNRTLGYAVLKQLEEMGLVYKSEEPGKVATFAPAHPTLLQERIDAQAKSAERAAIALKSALPDLSSAYNLATGRPGIRFYEGMDGIREVLNDSLTATEPVRAYVDNQAIVQHIPELNNEYVAARRRLNIARRNIATDTAENRFSIEGFLPALTEWRLIPWPATPINTITQLYDGKVSYFTLGSENLIGVIIADAHIFEFHRRQFDYLWDSSAVFAWPPKDSSRSKAA